MPEGKATKSLANLEKSLGSGNKGDNGNKPSLQQKPKQDAPKPSQNTPSNKPVDNKPSLNTAKEKPASPKEKVKEGDMFIIFIKGKTNFMVKEGTSVIEVKQQAATELKDGFKSITRVVRLSENTKKYFKDLLNRLNKEVVSSA